MTDGGDIELMDTDSDGGLTLWDTRMVAAIGTLQAARRGVIVLRIVAALVVLASTLGNSLIVFRDRYSDFATAKDKWAELLSSLAVPCSFAGMVLAASYLLAVYAARLDMDIILADDDEESKRRDRSDNDADSTSNGNADGDSMFKP